jgi:SulP family sulfate permease
VAGILHAAFLLLFMLVAAPLASYIPLAALAGVLAVVAWNMIERDAIVTLLRANAGEASVLGVTFLLTIFRDLTEAIVVGFALGAVLFIARMSRSTSIETATPFVPVDRPDDSNGGRTEFHEEEAADPDIVVHRIRGAFFFGAAASIGAVLDRISDTAHALILDLSAVPFIDSTAAAVIGSLGHKMQKQGIPLILVGTTHELRQELFSHDLKPPLVRYEPSLERARSYAMKRVEPT